MKKIRLVAIGAALVTGGAVITFAPSADAAEKTPQEIMNICNAAAKINGVQQSKIGVGSNKFKADTCDFVETKFEAYAGPTEKVTVDFPNCEPDATEPAEISVTWEASVAQGKGRYRYIEQGGGGLFGILSGSWLRHRGTLDLKLESASNSKTVTQQVPPGKVLHAEFTPKMQRMTGVWKVFTAERRQGTVLPAQAEVRLEAEEVVEGPVILPGAAGTPGLADGVDTYPLADC